MTDTIRVTCRHGDRVDTVARIRWMASQSTWVLFQDSNVEMTVLAGDTPDPILDPVEAEGPRRVNYTLTCPRCGRRVTLRDGRVGFVANKLRANGIDSVPLASLEAPARVNPDS